jgi:pantoate--beta-alanine ligase
MQIISSPREMQKCSLNERKAGNSIGVVPTMGYLHEGHIALMRQAKKENDLLVLTIFVNPAQFGPHEDFEKYPRDIEHDKEIATREGVDYCFTPGVADMYPEGYSTFVETGIVTEFLEGEHRQGHFRGVTTVVLKLLSITQPDNAYFGQKDVQQFVTIRKMVRDLNLPVTIVSVPTVREPDGLALSSRNVYLSQDERARAPVLYNALRHGESMYRSGERDARVIIGEMYNIINAAGGVSVDYVSIVDSGTFRPAERLSEGAEYCIAGAVRIGKTRLIDNIFISGFLGEVEAIVMQY